MPLTTALNAHQAATATPMASMPLVAPGQPGISAPMTAGAMPLQLAHPLGQVPMIAPHLAMPQPTHLHAANPAFAAAMAAATQNSNTSIPFSMHPQFPFLFLPPDGSLGMTPIMHPANTPTPHPHGAAIACAPPTTSQAQLRKQNQPSQQTHTPFAKPTQPSKSTSDQGDRKQSRYWTPEEHQRFLAAVITCGPKNYGQISEFVGTRNAKQVRTHAQKFQKRLEREEAKRRGAVGPFPTPGSMSHAAAAALSVAALGVSPTLATAHTVPALAVDPRAASEPSIGAAPSDGTGRTGEGSSSDNSAETDSRVLKKSGGQDDAPIAAAEAAAAAVAAEAVALGRGIFPADLLQGIAPQIASTVTKRPAACNVAGSVDGEQPSTGMNSASRADIGMGTSKITSSNPGESVTPVTTASKKVISTVTQIGGGISAGKSNKLVPKGTHNSINNVKGATETKTGGLMKTILNSNIKGSGSQIGSGVKNVSGNSVKLSANGQTAVGKKSSSGTKSGLKVNVPIIKSGTSTGKVVTGVVIRPASTSGKVAGGSGLISKSKVNISSTGQKVASKGAVNGVIRRVLGKNVSPVKSGLNTKNGKVLTVKSRATPQLVTDNRLSTKVGTSAQGDRRKPAVLKPNGNEANVKIGSVARKSISDDVKRIGITNGGTTKAANIEKLRIELVNSSVVIKDGTRSSEGQKCVSQNTPKNGIKLNPKDDTFKFQKVGNGNIRGIPKPVIKPKLVSGNTSRAQQNEQNQGDESEQNIFEIEKKEDILVDLAAAEDIVNEILGGEMSNDDEELGEIGSVVVSKQFVEPNSQSENGTINSTGKRSAPDNLSEQEVKRKKYNGSTENFNSGQSGESANDTVQVSLDGDDVEAEKGKS